MVFGLQRLAGHRLRREKMSEIIYKYFSTILHGERKVRVAGMDGLGGIGLDVNLLLEIRMSPIYYWKMLVNCSNQYQDNIQCRYRVQSRNRAHMDTKNITQRNKINDKHSK
jgi:hypothetical protein